MLCQSRCPGLGGRRWPNSALLLLLLLSGCAVTPLPTPPMVDPGATLHLYLQPLPQEAAHLTLTIDALSARTSAGQELPLLSEPLLLTGRTPQSRQTRLLVRELPAGDYQGLSLRVSQASRATEEGAAELLTPDAPQFLPQPFRIEADQARLLFLSLQPERMVTDGYRLSARFALWAPQPPLTALKGLVSHPEHGLVSFFEKKTPKIFDLLAVGQRPAGLTLDPLRRRAYLALGAEDAIVMLDLVRQRIERKIRLRPGDRPRRLELSADRNTLMVVNAGSNALSLIDASSFRERQRLLFTTRPAEVFSAPDAARAYVLLPDENALARIDVARGSVETKSSLAETPIRGLAAADGRRLYLLTENSPDLLVVDVFTLQVSSRIFIGYGATCLTATGNGQLYVGLQSGEIAVIDPTVDLALDSFQAGGAVVDLVPDLAENRLFVLTDRQQLEKYDLVSKRRLGIIELGSAGFEIGLMGAP